MGTLYFKVPGWPLGFGNDDTAEELLKQALVIDPEGIDANYFYADFLRDQGNYRAARQFLIKAQNAPLREGRAVADQGRRIEIVQALKAVNEELDD